MLVDCHCHIFTDRIVKNVKAKPAMVGQLKLNTRDAAGRLSPKALQESALANHVDVCVLLPSASPDRVRSENDKFIRWTLEFSKIRTLATLHPAMPRLSDEIERMFDSRIMGFKFSSFSQRFDPASPETDVMLNEVERLGRSRGLRPVAVFDTFMAADIYFGAEPDYLTTPTKLDQLAHRHRGMDVICAHMGGLLADFDDLRKTLLPAPNVFLDTSNAAHTLNENQFIDLLQVHGPSQILFGTDWPWFDHAAEKEKVGSLLTRAGFSGKDRDAVFGGNAARLLHLEQDSREF